MKEKGFKYLSYSVILMILGVEINCILDFFDTDITLRNRIGILGLIPCFILLQMVFYQLTLKELE